jgi:hypothetical protein
MRLNEIKPAEGSRKEGKRLGAAIPPARARPAAAASRASMPVPAAITRSASRAARCRCSAACRRSALPRARAVFRRARLGELAGLEGEVDLLALKSAGLVGQQVKRVKIIASGKIDKASPSRACRSPRARARPSRPPAEVSRNSVAKSPTSMNPATALGEAARVGDLRKRLFFLLGALVVYRIGTFIPVPGIDPEALARFFQDQQGTILSVFNMFSGGALERLRSSRSASCRTFPRPSSCR